MFVATLLGSARGQGRFLFWGKSLAATSRRRLNGRLTSRFRTTIHIVSFKKSGSCPYSLANMALNKSCGSLYLARNSAGMVPVKVTCMGSDGLAVVVVVVVVVVVLREL
eukprot:scaffold1057_cov154-Amphora_coffeaeformis.AAC.1